MLWISERIVLFLILFFWCSLSIFSVFPPSYSFFFPSSLVWLYPEHFFFFLPSSSLFSIPSCPLFYAPYTFSMPPRFFFLPLLCLFPWFLFIFTNISFFFCWPRASLRTGGGHTDVSSLQWSDVISFLIWIYFLMIFCSHYTTFFYDIRAVSYNVADPEGQL